MVPLFTEGLQQRMATFYKYNIAIM